MHINTSKLSLSTYTVRIMPKCDVNNRKLVNFADVFTPSWHSVLFSAVIIRGKSLFFLKKKGLCASLL